MSAAVNSSWPSNSNVLTPENLKRHRELVQILGIHDNAPGQYTTSYPSLHTLTLGPGDPATSELLPGGDPTGLVEINPSLVLINISRLDHYLLASFWRAIGNLPHLETFQIYDTVIDNEEDTNTFFRSCQSLVNLRLTDTSFTVKDDIINQLIFIRLRSLELDLVQNMDEMMQLDLIRQCPNLEELAWFIEYHAQALELFAKDVSRGLWPMLENLSFAFYIPDEDLGDILKAIRRITKLDMSRNDFGPVSFQALYRHFSTLTMLSLWACSAVTSNMLSEVLCSCPNLEEMKGNDIFAKDIIEGGPWVCLSMRVLEVCFVFRRADQNLQHMIFERLSRLERLEKLCIGGYSFPRRKMFQALDLRLESGFGMLEKLKNMKHLNCHYTTQSVNEKEIRWILANWKRLEIISGSLNQDSSVNALHLKLLHAQGITTN
ncbi:hypothetical protein BGX27_006955 [Mortierella sp. AM989]|nr:hypothetical protein BGX27_006955 [Mortierella sp. AM989]